MLGNGLFQSFKDVLLLLTPREFHDFIAQSVEGRRHVSNTRYEFMIKVYHPYETTNASSVAGAGNSRMALVRFRSMRTPAGETKCPRKEISCMANTTFSGLTLKPAIRARFNANQMCSRWSSKLSLYMTRRLNNGTQNQTSGPETPNQEV